MVYNREEWNTFVMAALDLNETLKLYMMVIMMKEKGFSTYSFLPPNGQVINV